MAIMKNIQDIKSQTEQLLNQAKTHQAKGESALAVAAFQAAEVLFASAADVRGQARCWMGIAKAYGKGKDLERSLEAFGEAARYYQLSGVPDKELEALYNRGLTLQQIGLKNANIAQVGLAIEAFEQALVVARAINDRESAGVLLLSLGFACAWSKREPEAVTYFAEAAPFALDTADFDTAFSALSTLGVLLSNNGRAAQAIPHYLRALELAKSAGGDLVAVADTFANLGVAYEKTGQIPEAIEALDTYREILHTVGDVKANNAAAMVKRLKAKL